jgi:hypothetical protein
VPFGNHIKKAVIKTANVYLLFNSCPPHLHSVIIRYTICMLESVSPTTYQHCVGFSSLLDHTFDLYESVQVLVTEQTSSLLRRFHDKRGPSILSTSEGSARIDDRPFDHLMIVC